MTTYHTHSLDTPEYEAIGIREWLEDRGMIKPTEEQVEAARAHKGTDPYLAALRAKLRRVT